jgi:RHS repeat-associated protein
LSEPQTRTKYSYDNANRTVQITQGSSNVALAYDNDSRRTTLTLPNAVTTIYGYDAASQLTGINYTLGSSTLGNLIYTYDLAGHRTSVGGSFAGTGLPAALANAGYNAGNQLMQSGSSNLSYDANGNMTSDGVNTYTWDVRNHLVSIGGKINASFQYDAFGRRVSKTIGGTEEYLYDSMNPVQELSGDTPSANLLAGLAVDEYFQRTDSSGSANFLTDALGSTLALTGPSGNVLAQYTYEPYGNTTVTGTSTNPFQYTGREDDATGLYFYRARYYNTATGRFLSEDPIRFHGGIDFYAYAGNNPSGYVDPSGLVCCTPEKRQFFDWLSAALGKMALDLDTTKALLLTLAAKEGGWNEEGLDHNMPLSNPFGTNIINNKGQAAGNINYTQLAGGDPNAGLNLAVGSWEQMFGNRVQGVKAADDFVYGLQHPDSGRPYNTVNRKYEDQFQDLYDTMLKYMKACGVI